MPSSLLGFNLDACWKVKATLSRYWDITFIHIQWKIELADSDSAGYLNYSVLKNIVPWLAYILIEIIISYCINFFQNYFNLPFLSSLKDFFMTSFKNFWLIMYNKTNDYFTPWMNYFLTKISRSFKSTE